MRLPNGKTTGGPGEDGSGESVGRHTRTEFVILFVWREPTPSDGLRGGLTPAEGGEQK